MIAFYAVRKKQMLLRAQLEAQERLRDRVAVFAGLIDDIPQWVRAKRICPPEYFEAST